MFVFPRWNLASWIRCRVWPRSEVDVIPMEIVIGENVANPVVVIREILPSPAFDSAARIGSDDVTISRLSSVLQAVPAVLAAGEIARKRIMEVVVNGDLVRAADGIGFRATVRGPNNFAKNARLFDVNNLQNLINVAAVWQVASVVVAQKHLADISAKLDEIKEGVQAISAHLNRQRSARIAAIQDYLIQARETILAGELSPSMRMQLERSELDLLEIQIHLDNDFRSLAEKRIKDKGTFGAGTFVEDIDQKIVQLNHLADEISACMQTRVALWHVLSLFPGEPILKRARHASIDRAIKRYQVLSSHAVDELQEDISKVSAIFNSKPTLLAYRSRLKASGQEVKNTIEKASSYLDDSFAGKASKAIGQENDTRILLEFDGATFVGARRLI
jgi:hypothetical protein